MAKILELHSAKVRNTLNDVLPPENSPFYSTWYDSSGNNNHGVLTALVQYNTESGWLGSYDFDDYFNLKTGSNAAYLTVPALNSTNFPQNEGTLFFVTNRLSWSNINYSLLFSNAVNNNIFARITQTGAEYGIQCGIVGSDGLYKGVIMPADYSTNRIVLNTVNKIAIKYKTGVGGYVALFINGVKIAQASITSSTTFPSAQNFEIGKGSGGADRMKAYYVMMDDTALTDEEIITIQNTEWKEAPYSLPTLNKSYVAWGDSITWTQANGKEYPNLVHNYVKNTYGKMAYFNKGIGGLTSAELVTNLNSLNYIDGDIVTIGVGTNDSANEGVSVANYTTNLGLAIDFIRSRNANAKIILCTPCGTSSETRTPYIADYRTAMEAVATAKGCYLCKFHEAVTDANIGTYSSDGIHPNVAGHVLLMGKLKPIIDEILG